MEDLQLLDDKISQQLSSKELIKKLEIAIRKLTEVWSKYQPRDSLAATRKQDLMELRNILQQYQQLPSEKLKEKFWQGYFEGKGNRRLIKKNDNLNLSLLSSLFNAQRKEAFELGVKTGWQYARLKSYLIKVANLEREKLRQYQEMMRSRQSNSQNLDYTFGEG